MTKRKYLLMLALSVITLSLSGCGNEAETNSDGTTTLEDENQVAEDSSNEGEVLDSDSSEDVLEIVNESESDTTESAIASDVEAEDDTESTEDTAEPEVEMVDFETWAKQEGNDEVCLVVWNEATKTQRIIKPMEEYVVQEGDRFAVPYKENVRVNIGE